MIRPLIESMRPHQWVKNTFVLAPLIFARQLTSGEALTRATVAMGLFCLISGAVYIMNDLFDVEKDRAHPTKKNRPIASGRLSPGAARLSALLLAFIAILGGLAFSPPFALAVSVYGAVNLAYSRFLKHLPYVDVATIAFGFLIRIHAGAIAISVPLSGWILACTFLLALNLGMGKRRHEILQAAENAKHQRKVLEAYQLGPLTMAMIWTSLATTATYTAYAVEDHTHDFGTDRLWWTIPFCVIGLTRFFRLTSDTSTARSPTEQITRDIPFLLNLAAWAGLMLYLIYA